MSSTRRVASKIMVYSMIVAGLLDVHAAEPTAQEHVVEIVGFKFVPEKIEVHPGDTVTWINRDIVPHTATGKDGTWDTGTLNQDDSISFVVSEKMESNYFCRFHINMVGSISISSGENSNGTLEQR